MFRVCAILRHRAAGLGAAATPSTPEIRRRPANYAVRQNRTFLRPCNPTQSVHLPQAFATSFSIACCG